MEPYIKVLGVVEAGFPGTAEEDIHEMSLDDFLIQKREASYMLRVKGDSMIDAGIIEGDYVIVERGAQPKIGDIVIARIDGAFTMKYYRKDASGNVYLEAANGAYPPLYPSQDLVIEAVVRANVRKYE